jgi:selenide,water dikinase
MEDVHALTDVTGFGLLGHLLEICRASAVGARIAFDRVPLLPDAEALAGLGFVTGASSRNWSSYGDEVDGDLDGSQRALLSDPQTSGGLLVACSRDAVDAVLRAFRADGFDRAAVIGETVAGMPRVTVTAGGSSAGGRGPAIAS